MEQIARNLERIERQIAAACGRAGRSRADVLLIAVSKTFPAEAIDAAVAAGISDIGENRVQEFRDKAEKLTSRPVAHLIGHLQSNKAKDAVRLFDVVHTVDSTDLAERLSRHAVAAGKTIRVLVQINLGAEEQKSGVAPVDAPQICERVAELSHLTLGGLMTIPPVASEIETRSYFRSMRLLRDQTEARLGSEKLQLSMGMSDDFEIAIEEGATMIRLGRALFGARD